MFKGKTVVITGAGGGLGSAYAFYFAGHGANVVVNDLFGGQDVVNKIKERNQVAVLNTDSVLSGSAIIDFAIKQFGAVHVLINNAGILRDKSFAKMTQQEWTDVLNIHLHGTFSLTKAAWSQMQKQKYGRIVNTSSAAGLYGNIGQTNYSAAKLALHGFTLSLSKESSTVLVNSIAPIAASKMTKTVLPEDILEKLNPEYICPFVGYLSHESCTEQGSMFELGANFVCKLRRQRSKGIILNPLANASNVKDLFSRVDDFKDCVYPDKITDTDWISLLELAKTQKFEQKPDLSYAGRVVLVTGAGNGLGRAYAFYFAKLGAQVIVNDVLRNTVADELTNLGFKAHFICCDVVKGSEIINEIISKFHRIDVIINNAGILRDRSFAKMTQKEWMDVLNIHLNGTFSIIKAAWTQMQKQKYGRILNTSSAVGLYGNFGQTNYAAAKSGIIGLSLSLSLEGERHNIKVNVLCPNAGTQMTKTVMPPSWVEALKPELICPYVGYLCHESCNLSGNVYECGSSWISKVIWQRTKGKYFDLISFDGVKQSFREICNFDKAQSCLSARESFSLLFKPKQKSKYTERDVILYALGIGSKSLNQLYENHPLFKPSPFFAIVMGFECLTNLNFDFVQNFELFNLLHGEQKMEIFSEIPNSGVLESESTILKVEQKKTNVIVKVRVKTYHNDVLCCSNESTLFIRNAKADDFSIDQTQNLEKVDYDEKLEEKTLDTQAKLYRLSGDLNPLHIDPNIAKMAGFNVPILHGLCTLGFGGRMVQQHYKQQIKSIQGRMSSHVFPGETLIVEMKNLNSKVYFQVRVKERSNIVISNGLVEFNTREIVVSVADYMRLLQQKLTNSTKKGVIVIHLESESWVLDFYKKQVYLGTVSADLTLTMKSSDFIELCQNPKLQNKFKANGNMELLSNLDILKNTSNI